jgi:lipopolysaccharide transport system ATP-binding protein
MTEEKEVLVQVKQLSKKFSTDLKRSLWYGLLDVLNILFLRKRTKVQRLRKEEFWAVRNINFELRRGECLGLIGHNGAGKSTLLKMLNGLIKPDEGSIVMRGKIGALIELGAGFNPLLTGRENIYINGQLLGFTSAEIESKLQTILDFAEIGAFIDSPVQNYSSGMKVRLGFAIAAQMEPDVLIIDEVLAVGDLGFVLKCFNVIDQILPKTAVIFVSHNMPQVSRICTKILLMEKGNEAFFGNEVSKGIDAYYRNFSQNKKASQFERNEDGELLEFYFGERKGDYKMPFAIDHGDDLKINMKLKIKADYPNPAVSVIVFDKEQRPVGICANEAGLDQNQIYERNGNYAFYQCSVTIPRINLSKGIFSVTVVLAERFNYKPMLRIQNVEEFQVYSKHQFWPPVEFEGIWQ